MADKEQLQAFASHLLSLTEALNTSENNLLIRFIPDPNATIEVSNFTGTGRIRGAKASSGKREYEAAEKLASTGVLDIVKRENTGSHRKLVVRLKNKSALSKVKIPSEVESVLRQIAKYEETADTSPLPFGGKRGIKTSTRKAIEMAAELGLSTSSTLEPRLTDAGRRLISNFYS